MLHAHGYCSIGRRDASIRVPALLLQLPLDRGGASEVVVRYAGTTQTLRDAGPLEEEMKRHGQPANESSRIVCESTDSRRAHPPHEGARPATIAVPAVEAPPASLTALAASPPVGFTAASARRAWSRACWLWRSSTLEALT